MKLRHILSQYGKELFFTGLSLLNFGQADAQVSLIDMTPYNQQFNTLTQSAAGTTWTDNGTITGWYVTGGPSTTIKATTGTDMTDGLKSYGSAASTDRALGCVTSWGTGNFYYGLRLKNNTGKVIRDLNVSYRLETWRTSNNHKTDLRFSYRKASTVTSLTSGTWTNFSALDVNVAKGTSTGAVDGNVSPNYYTVSALISNLELANGDEIMLRWNDMDNNKAIYLGLDDITITPLNTERIFYSKASGNLHNTSTWTVNADGSAGTEPLNFTGSYQRFVLLNRTTPTLTANWTVSGQESKVVVGNGTAAVNFTVPSLYTFSGTVDVENSATLTVNSSTLPAIGTLGATSTVIYNSAAAQSLAAGQYGNLVITGTGTKSLAANTIVNTQLTLSSNSLELQNFNLELAAGATISGADSTAFIVTKGSGRLRRQVQNNNTSVEFPVGTDAYAPVQIRQALTGTTDFFSVKAIDGIYDYYMNNEPVGEVFTSEVVNHTWIIDEDVVGGSDVTIAASWKRTAGTADFDIAAARLNHFTAGAWDNATAGGYQKTGSYYMVSRSGITSFSPFGVFSGFQGGGMTPLPVKLISFRVSRENKTIFCNWQTAMELNNASFAIERSLDGKNFTQIGIVKGAGTTAQTTTYSFTDTEAPAAKVYYRLRQNDFDGTTEYSAVRMAAALKMTDPVLLLYPNPSAGVRYLQSDLPVTGAAELVITDLKGNVVRRQMVQPELLQNGIALDLTGQPKGLYFIRVATGSNVMTIKAVQN